MAAADVQPAPGALRGGDLLSDPMNSPSSGSNAPSSLSNRVARETCVSTRAPAASSSTATRVKSSPATAARDSCANVGSATNSARPVAVS